MELIGSSTLNHQARAWVGTPAGGLALRPLDLARIAYLISLKGKWNEIQIVPENWFQRISNGNEFRNFETNLGGQINNMYPHDLTIFSGRGGSMVAIVPSMDLIAIRTDRFLHKDEETLQKQSLQLLFEAVDP